MTKILKNPDNTSFDIESLIHGFMKEKLPELELAIDGYITLEQATKLKFIKEHFDSPESQKDSDLYKKSNVIPITREITVEQTVLVTQFQGYCIKSAIE